MKRRVSKLLTPVTSPIAYSKKLHFSPDVFELSVPGQAMLVDQYSIQDIANTHSLTFSCPLFLFFTGNKFLSGKGCNSNIWFLFEGL